MNQIKRKRKYLRFFVVRLRNVDTFEYSNQTCSLFRLNIEKKKFSHGFWGSFLSVRIYHLSFSFYGFSLVLSYQNDHSDKRVCYDIETPCDYWHEYQTTIWGHKAMQLCNYNQPHWRLYLSPWKNITKHRWKKNPYSKALGRSKIHNTSLD